MDETVNDSLESSVLITQKERRKPELDALIAEGEALLASRKSQQSAPRAPAATPTPAASSPSFMSETGRAIVGGVRDFAQNTINTIDELGTWANNNLIDLRVGSETFGKIGGAGGAAKTGEDLIFGSELPDIEDNQTMVGGFARNAVQFLVPFVGSVKALRTVGFAAPATRAGAIAEGTAVGAAVEGAAFDPTQQRVSNMILDMTDHDPVIGKAVLEYLAADPNDSALESRFKMALEGAGLGVAVDGLFLGVKAVKNHWLSKGMDPAQATVEAAGREGIATAQDAVAKVHESISQHIDAHPGIADITTKRAPRVNAAGLDTLTEAVKTGKLQNIAKALDTPDFNLANIDSDKDIDTVINSVSKVFAGETDIAKHGVQSFGSIEKLAKELGAGVKSLKELYGNTDNLAARVTAHRTLLAASAEQVSKLAQVATASGNPSDLLAFRKQVAVHAGIQMRMKGVQTEIGRALASFRIAAKSSDLRVNEMNEMLDGLGGQEATLRYAHKLAALADNPEKFNAVVRRSATARTQDALFEGWVNGLLSGPTTHAVNFTSNALVVASRITEEATAAAIGAVRGTADRITAGEVRAMSYGMMQGVVDSLRVTKHGLSALKTAGGRLLRTDLKGAREAVLGVGDDLGTVFRAFSQDAPILDDIAHGTLDQGVPHAISGANLGLKEGTVTEHAVDVLGAVLRTPGSRMLVTADELFKTIHYRGSLHSEAYRRSVKEGLTGDKAAEFITKLVDDPTPEMRAMALRAAREGTFTSSLGPSGQSIQHFVANFPGARYIMPFVRTPANLLKFIGRRTPGVHLLSETMKADIAAGGARRDLAHARLAMGATMYGTAYMMAEMGLITGGGEKDKQAEYTGGWQPYSIKLGDKYVSYNRLDPFGAFFGIIADIRDISVRSPEMDVDELVNSAIVSFSKNVMSKSYLSGLIDFIEAMSNPEMNMQNFLEQQSSTFLPMSSAVKTIRREVDPGVKEVQNLVDAWKASVPGLSDSVPNRVNMFGQDVTYEGALGPDILSPFRMTTEKDDPAARAVKELNLDLRAPSRTIAREDGKGIDLTPQQYHRWMKLAGNELKLGGMGFHDQVKALVTSPQWKNMTTGDGINEGTRHIAIRRLREGYQKAAFAQLLQEDKELHRQWVQGKRDRAKALLSK